MIHRDFKPKNIFMVSDGTLKLGDFGLARTVADQSHKQRAQGADGEGTRGEGALQTSAVPLSKPRLGDSTTKGGKAIDAEGNTAGVGTALYSSPEQEAGGEYEDKTDMFSLGVVLFELLHPPFATGMERMLLLQQLRTGGMVGGSTEGMVGGGSTEGLAAWAATLQQLHRGLYETLCQLVDVRPERRPAASVVCRRCKGWHDELLQLDMSALDGGGEEAEEMACRIVNGSLGRAGRGAPQQHHVHHAHHAAGGGSNTGGTAVGLSSCTKELSELAIDVASAVSAVSDALMLENVVSPRSLFPKDGAELPPRSLELLPDLDRLADSAAGLADSVNNRVSNLGVMLSAAAGGAAAAAATANTAAWRAIGAGQSTATDRALLATRLRAYYTQHNPAKMQGAEADGWLEQVVHYYIDKPTELNQRLREQYGAELPPRTDGKNGAGTAATPTTDSALGATVALNKAGAEGEGYQVL
jgi:hypothetical protein